MTLALTLLLASPLPPPELPPLEGLPILTTWYDPLQFRDEMNCLNPPEGCEYFGSGMRIESYHYGTSAACRPEWAGMRLEIYNYGWDGSSLVVWCRDSGGNAIRVRYDREYGLYIPFDILSSEPIPLGPWYEWRLSSESEAVTN